MITHLSLIYQVIIIGIGIAAMAVCILRAARSGREDHVSFVFFWLVFTSELIVTMVKAYILTNIVNPKPQMLLLLQAVSFDCNLLIVASVLRYLHRLGNVRGRQIKDAVVLGAMLVSIVAIAVPWGIEFDAGNLTISFRTGYWIAIGYYLLGLLYAACTGWVFVARRPRNEAPAFLIVMAVFATTGLLESFFSFIGSIARQSAVIKSASFMFSSIPYAIYGIFLIVNGRIEESPGQARIVHLTPKEDRGKSALRSGESKDPSLFLQAAMDRMGLSKRERDVVVLILDGRSNQEIADHLYVSLATIKTHIYRIYRKASVPSRYALIRIFANSA